MEPEHIPKQLMNGLYTQRNKIRWMPRVKLGGATYLTEEQNRLKGLNLDAGNGGRNDDDDNSCRTHILHVL
jgi:hypothetical protein